MQPLIAIENGKPIIVINAYEKHNQLSPMHLRGFPLPVDLSTITDANAVEFLRAIQGYYEQAEKGTLAKGYKPKHLSGAPDGLSSLRGTTFGEV